MFQPQSRRDKPAAKRLLRTLLTKQRRPPRVLVTDKRARDAAAQREIMPGVEHRQHKGINSRAENSRQPTRRRERQMKRFLPAYDQANNLFHLRRHPATQCRTTRGQAFRTWAKVTSVAATA